MTSRKVRESFEVGDIAYRRPNWTLSKCDAVLQELDNRISDAMSEAGNNVIDDCISEYDEEEEEE